MDSASQRVLERLNPWLTDPASFDRAMAAHLPSAFFRRDALPTVGGAFARAEKAHLLIGPRQCGKSTLVWSLIRQRGLPVLFVNCEEPSMRRLCRSAALFADEIGPWMTGPGVLFFNEAQWLDEAGLFIKGLVDAKLGHTLVVTGSASFHLLSRTRESLAGRATRHRLWPFSLSEATAAPEGLAPAAARALARRALQRQLVVGGYPEAWSSPHPDRVLGELVDAFVLRDASDRFRIARPDAFRTLMQLAAGQVGDLVNRSELAQILGVAASTVDDYLTILEETHIIRRIRPFNGGKRAELTQTPKLFFVDNGLRNALAGNLRPIDQRADQGKLLENWVFTELNKAFPEPGGVRYWRTRSGAEVDFVLEPRPGQILPIEVKPASGLLRLPRSARSFIEAYKPPHFLIVYRGTPRTQPVGETQVEWLPAELLPQRVNELTTEP